MLQTHTFYPLPTIHALPGADCIAISKSVMHGIGCFGGNLKVENDINIYSASLQTFYVLVTGHPAWRFASAFFVLSCGFDAEALKLVCESTIT